MRNDNIVLNAIVLSAVMFGSIRLFTTSLGALNEKWMKQGVAFGLYEATNVTIMASSGALFWAMCAGSV